MARTLQALIVVPLSIVLACGGGSSASPEEAMTVRGQVVEVQGKSITDLAFLAVRDEQGNLWEFSGDGFLGLTPSHLREHQAFGQPVTVTYRETSDGLVVVGLSD